MTAAISLVVSVYTGHVTAAISLVVSVYTGHVTTAFSLFFARAHWKHVGVPRPISPAEIHVPQAMGRSWGGYM